MKKKFLFLMALLAVSLLALAEMTVYVYKKDGTKVPYVASTIDSIGFVNVHTITFNANGGTGSMDVVRVKEGESITLPTNEFSNAKAEFASWNTAANGSGTAYADKGTVKPTANITLYAQWEVPTTGTENGHEWVDLGLPSGTKWATMNVGTNSPEDYGDYFAWGETTTKSSYNSSNYNYSTNPATLPLDRDAAYTNWGTSWRMPTKVELDELKENCTWTWTTQNDVEGYKVTSKTNGNSIFLPAAGYRNNSDLYYAGSFGDYWSSSLSTYDSYYAYCLNFIFGDVVSGYGGYRYYGRSVRPVLRDVEFTIMFDGNGGEGTMPAIDGQHDDRVKIPASTFTREGYYFASWNTKADGTGTSYKVGEVITQAEDLTLYAQWEAPKDTGIADGHEWVDLGLPSETKWATCNVGANAPEEYGDYFAWGETTTKSDYSCSTYKWCKGSSNTQTKYCTDSYYGTVDNKTFLDLSDDAAYVNWGTSWRMPAKVELDELIENCTWTWTTQNGVKGHIVTSKTNGNSIFLPAAGYRYDSELNVAGYQGYYVSRSLNTDRSDYAYYLYIVSGGAYNSSSSNRYYGLSVRPVLRE